MPVFTVLGLHLRGVAFGVVLLALAALQSAWGQQVAVPAFERWVIDQTGTLDSNTHAHLESRLAALDAAKGAQLAVLIISTTGDDTVESYSRRVFDRSEEHTSELQ